MKVTSVMAWLSARSARQMIPMASPTVPAISRRRSVLQVRRMNSSPKSMLFFELYRTTSRAAIVGRSSQPPIVWHDLLEMLIEGREILFSQALLHRPLQNIRSQRTVGTGLSNLPRQVCGHPQVLGEVGRSRTAVEGA